MFLKDKIIGKNIVYRSAEISDAEFTLSIRQNRELTKYIPYLDITVEQQREWIRQQRERYKDLFFIMEYKDGTPFGTCGFLIYDDAHTEYESTRLISLAPPHINLESTFLRYDFAFNSGCEKLYGHFIDGNKKSAGMFKLLGGKYDRREVNDRWTGERWVLLKEDYLKNRNSFIF